MLHDLGRALVVVDILAAVVCLLLFTKTLQYILQHYSLLLRDVKNLSTLAQALHS